MAHKKLFEFFFVLTRIALGSFMLYAGVSKLLSQNWSAQMYLEKAQTFSSFYQWLAQPDILPFVNIGNSWGLTLLGVSLILGIFVRLSGFLGAVLMLLYYFPILHFPIAGERALLIDEHIIYALLLLSFSAGAAGRIFGVDRWLVKKFPKLSRLA